MVWFRQAASHYQSRCWQIYVALLRHNVLSNNINGDPALQTRLRGKNTDDRWFSQKISHAEFCVCFVFSLNNLLGKQSCPWLKTLWRQCHFTVLTVFNGHCIHVCFFPTLSNDRARPIPLAQPEREACMRSLTTEKPKRLPRVITLVPSHVVK